MEQSIQFSTLRSCCRATSADFRTAATGLMNRLSRGLLALLLLTGGGVAQAAELPVIKVGLNAEFSVPSSTSAQAIEMGLRTAIHEINARGGVLGGRKFELVTRDDRSVPARAIVNVRELAAMPDVVAVFGGKYSPVVMELLPVVEELKIPFLATWSAADGIIDSKKAGSYMFRLSLKDTWAVQVMIDYLVRQRRAQHIGVLLPNTAWGRSSFEAAKMHQEKHKNYRLTPQWYNWGDKSLMTQYQALRTAGVDGVMMVANELEGSILVREMAQLPDADRKPVAAHWGITGGNFVGLTGGALAKIDLSVVQTFTFNDPLNARRRQVLQSAREAVNAGTPLEIPSHVGFAHAYDLMQVLARAVDKARSTDRVAVRQALEQVRNYQGLVRDYAAPFTAERHEALAADNIFLSRFREDGMLERRSSGTP